MFGMLFDMIISGLANKLAFRYLTGLGVDWSADARMVLAQTEEILAEDKKTRAQTEEALAEAQKVMVQADERLAAAEKTQAQAKSLIDQTTRLKEHAENSLKEFESLSKENKILTREANELRIEMMHQTLIKVAHLAGQMEAQFRAIPKNDVK